MIFRCLWIGLEFGLLLGAIGGLLLKLLYDKWRK